MNKVVAFGVFDGFHGGHRFFLREARKLGNALTVVIARDAVVKRAKGRKPMFSLRERMDAIKKEFPAVRLVMGDRVAGSWSVFGRIEADIVAIGYDQGELCAALKEYAKNAGLKLRFEIMEAHKPHLYKSSILNKKRDVSERPSQKFLSAL